ncbi:P83/100 family protein [Borreliella finlandensis]|uniref:P83/100 family protein n=1 Tax=Borreliella finlandensis TaxID=498741 RepID=UPI002648DC3E|nr:P83/100 family protein [Borreliella finlandensis]WKC90237.1 P83/100 family protein [Borreliella finlandensis]
MKKMLLIFSFFLIFLNGFPVSAREVDREKLKDFVNMDLEFVNYKGPYDSTNTYEQIVGIGEFLARPLTNSNSNSSYYGKYFINRFIDDQDKKASVDVFSIGSKSELDSILNLRRILTGYLIKSFDYDRSSAELIAKVITIYNAVYRGDWDYYKGFYIEAALKSLTKENAGLSRVYSQWAGKTQIFIPLKKDILSGNIESDIDIDSLVTDKVVAALLSENEAGVNFARDITDIQGETHKADQDKIDIELDNIHESDSNITETIENLRDQLEKATDEEHKKEIESQVDAKKKQKEELDKKAINLDKAQQKLDSAEDNLDVQRNTVREKIQEDINEINKEKNLPKPGYVSSPKVDKQLQIKESLEDLQEQLKETGDENQKREIEKQIEIKKSDEELLKSKDDKTSKDGKALDLDRELNSKASSKEKSKVKEEEIIKGKSQKSLGDLNNDENLMMLEDQKLPEDKKLDSKKEFKPVSEVDKLDKISKSNNNVGELSLLDKPSYKDIDSKEETDNKDINLQKTKPQVKDQGTSLNEDLTTMSVDSGSPVFLEVIDPITNLGTLQLIDLNTGVRLKESTQQGIQRYGIYEREKDLVVIKMDSGKAKLQILDKLENLKVVSESNFEINKNSSLYVDSKMILVAVRDKDSSNDWRLAKFSPKNLDNFILSENKIMPFTSFSVRKNFIYLQDEFKSLVILDANTLKKVK